MANLALGVGEGDEVICPALTYVATANAVTHAGGTVVFADSRSERDLTIDPRDIESKVTPRTKAVAVVHYAGFPCAMGEVLKVARRHRLRVIEDCAHAPGAWCRDGEGPRRYVGSIGDVGCFSFFGNKNMTTGEGGMVTTNDDALAERLRLLRSHGMTSLSYERRGAPARAYDVIAPGFNYRIDDIRSAIGVVQLGKLDRHNAKRRRIFRWYEDALKKNGNVIIPFLGRDLEGAAPHIMPVMMRSGYRQVRDRLTRAGVQTSKHFDLIPTFTLYRGTVFQSRIPHIHDILTLPMYPGMTRDDVRYVGKVISGWAPGGRRSGLSSGARSA